MLEANLFKILFEVNQVFSTEKKFTCNNICMHTEVINSSYILWFKIRRKSRIFIHY